MAPKKKLKAEKGQVGLLEFLKKQNKVDRKYSLRAKKKKII